MKLLMETPSYVWLLLAFLMYRGWKATKDGKVSMRSMMIAPLIFMVLGLQKVIAVFPNVALLLSVYSIVLVIGTYVGYVLYRKYRSLYVENATLYRTGTYVTLIVILVNFIIKYALNVGMAIMPQLTQQLGFDLLYTVLCGASVGLFLGGVYQVMAYKKTLGQKQAEII